MMKKQILLIGLIIILLLSLVGACAKPSPPAAAPVPAPAPAPAPAPPPEVEQFPIKPITFIVCLSPGGVFDVTARFMASVIPEYLDAGMFVVNKTGGGGVVGQVAAAQSNPDGYTITISATSYMGVMPYAVKDLPFSPDDFDALLGVGTQGNGLVVLAESPYETLDDLVQAAKANPGKLTFSTPGAVSQQEMNAEYFNTKAGIKTTHVPYEGGGPAVVAVLGGHVDFGVVGLTPAAPHVKAGALRLLCVFTDARDPLFPETPTAMELGYDVSCPNTLYILAPTGVPEARKQILHDALKKVLESETFLTLTKAVPVDWRYISPEEAKQIIESEGELYKEIIASIER